MGKSTLAIAVGILSVIIGLIALSAGMIEYPIWKHNDEVLRWNELMGDVSSEDRRVVMLQFILTFGGIVFGIIFLLLGLYLLWESPLDRLTDRLHQMFSSQQKSSSPQPLPQVNKNQCPDCERIIESDWVRCPNCLLLLKIECPHCKEKIDIRWRACPHCGSILNMKTIIKKEAV